MKKTKKKSATKSTSPSTIKTSKTEHPPLTPNVKDAFRIIEGMGDADVVRSCGIGVQDLGIIDPIDGWANGMKDCVDRFNKVLFKDEDCHEVHSRFIKPALSLEKVGVSTSEPLTIAFGICMMAGVLAFMES